MRDTKRDTGRGKSRLHAGSPMQDSIQVSRITPWAEGGAKLLGHPGCPDLICSKETKTLGWGLEGRSQAGWLAGLEGRSTTIAPSRCLPVSPELALP